MNYNRVMIAGNLTRDPETKFLSNDNAVASFSMACNRKYRTADGEKKEDVTFVDVEAWGRLAELIGQYCIKGKTIFVEGRLKLDTWTDQQGNKRSRLKVLAENVQFIGRVNGDSGQGNDQQPPAAKQAANYNEEDGEPPF